MIVVDTSVWSRAFRRSKRKATERTTPESARVLEQLITEHMPIALPGIVLHEILSGVRTPEQFEALRHDLMLFPILLADEDDHAEATHIVNACTAAGIATASIDALIAAMTIRAGGYLLTCDSDFQRIADHSALRIRLLDA